MTTTSPPEAYRAISVSTQRIWEGKFTLAQQEVEPFVSTSICAALAHSEVLVWVYSLDNLETSYDHAMNSFTALEEKVNVIMEQSKPEPTSMLSSFGSFFGDKPSPKVKNVNKQKDYIESLVTLGDISGAIAMLHLKKQDRMKGAYRLRRAWKCYQEASQLVVDITEWQKLIEFARGENPEEEDASVWEQLLQATSHDENLSAEELRSRNVTGRLIFGEGLFCYTISMLPKSLQWIVELIGFESDRKKGLSDVLASSKIQPSPRSYWSRIALGTIRYFLFDESEQALALVEQLQTELKNSPMLYMTLGGMYRAEGELSKSNDCFRQAHDSSAELPPYQLLADYELGSNYFLSCKWEEAIPLIESYVQNSKSPNFKCYAGYKLGLCYWAIEKENAMDKIEPLFQNVVGEWKRAKMSYDVYSARHCALFLQKRHFTELQCQFVEISNYLEVSLFEKAEELLSNVKPESLKSVDDQGMFLYLRGHCHKKKEENIPALKVFNELVQLADQLQDEKWVVPYAELESIEIFIKEKKFKKANMVLDMVKKRSSYDFEKHVSMRIKKLQSKTSRAANN